MEFKDKELFVTYLEEAGVAIIDGNVKLEEADQESQATRPFA